MIEAPPIKRSLIERGLALMLFLLLLVALYSVVRVFVGVFTFALIFSVSFHRLYEKICSRYTRRRKLVAVVYAVLLITIVALPFVYIISALSHHLKDVIAWVNDARENGLPPLPDWIVNLPVVGDDINAGWQEILQKPKEILALHQEQVKHFFHTILTRGIGIIGVTLEIIAGVIVSALFLVNSERILEPLRLSLSHIMGEKDARSLEVASAQAIKGVSIGVMGTAFISAILAWIGLKIAGLPFSLALAAIIFFLVLIQVGPMLVWIPVTIMVFMQGHTGMGVFLVAYGIGLLVADSLLKPMLIAKSGKLPFLLLFIGVVGGLVAWGFTGMFKGAIVVTIFYTIFNSWLERRNSIQFPPTSDPAAAESSLGV